ncbi:citrate/2-methylcitrate synthase [Brachyspira pilosicoli]|uniref:citrate/2-methylcitrate synthase n=1 Tax=Brachyspira pilosicoli TaxID=52584 RepID=UPI00255D1406|nr:citrate/2-methylcitrate synthase [Brachyspira pilosicoli]
MKKEYLLYKLYDHSSKRIKIDSELFQKYNVKKGLRNEDGTGVLVGLTNVGDVVGYDKDENGNVYPIDGKLYYRGYDLNDIANDILTNKRFGYEEVCYLLLSGKLPDMERLQSFKELISDNMYLDKKTIMNIIDLEGQNIMNILSRSVLEMYIHDPNPEDLSLENLMLQSIQLIARFPAVIAYAYNMFQYSVNQKYLNITLPKPKYSIAENFLYMLKQEFSELEARMLDLLLILHAEHGGGNNSTFTVRVTSSTRTDTYSSISAGIGSLKGDLHGGANAKVMDMLIHLKEAIDNWESKKEIDEYLMKMLNKEAYDKSGLIYGMGHAVYTLSDPRAVILKDLARQLAKEKKKEKELAFMELIEERAIECFIKVKGEKKRVCANVDLYSGFIYEMLGISKELYTPLFAMSRIVGWCAHRIEELNFDDRRIIRPAYKNVSDPQEFISMDKR